MLAPSAPGVLKLGSLYTHFLQSLILLNAKYIYINDSNCTQWF